ncbi:PRC-barrel domain-containing protein [Synechococcus sp. UW105]|uniref:PRC-barrel domain-containing protein n=1 Tax=unclassified Synechococcus TaxID=2626047 RepID=UPI000E0FAA5B|nr:PRC-barrel domain-containing protein [Synechococcus sp. UW105]RZO13663.1 MAG: photosystem reaction center subunit H [Synechococcus sp. MED-G135]
MTSTPTPNDPLETVPSDRLWLRSELMGTQVITRDTGRRLGVVGEVIVDIDGREVVALGLRDNPLTRFLPGLPRWMRLERIRQVGDVILVDSIDSLSETFSPERYSRVINCQVITESGSVLGRVLGFSFDIETGELSTLVMGALGVPLLGEGVLSTWEIPVDEIVSSGPDRIIVYEGAEDKLKQLNSGVLEKLGVGGPSWEEQERERYRVNVVPVENQLSSGQPAAEQQKQLQASESASFAPEEELEYVEVEDRRSEQQSQRRYMDDLPERDAYSRRDSYDSQDDDRRQAYSDQERYGQDRYRDTSNAAPDDNADSYGDERFERERFPRDRNEPPERYAADPQPWDDAVAMNPDPEVGMEVDRFEARPRPAARRAVQPPEDPLDVEPLEADEAYASRSDREPLPNRNDLDDPW